MDCKIIKKLLSAYLDGTLDMQEKAMVENHLRRCQSCSAELKSLEDYRKNLTSLRPIKAPADFLERVKARIEKDTVVKKVVHALLMPFQHKYSLRVATVVATILILFSVYKIMTPSDRVALKAPGTKMEEAAEKIAELKAKERAARPTGSIVVNANAPIEIALVVGEAYESPQESVMGAASAPKAGAGEDIEKSAEDEYEIVPSFGLDEAVLEVKKHIEVAGGKVISVDYEKESGIPQYITTDIPARNYTIFLRKLYKVGYIRKPSYVPPAKGFVRLRIRLSSSQY